MKEKIKKNLFSFVIYIYIKVSKESKNKIACTSTSVKYLDVGPQSEIHRWKKTRGIVKGSIVPLSLWRIDKSSGLD